MTTEVPPAWRIVFYRFFYFAYVGRRFVVLHAYRKQGRKTPRRELAIAEHRLKEVLQEGLNDER